MKLIDFVTKVNGSFAKVIIYYDNEAKRFWLLNDILYDEDRYDYINREIQSVDVSVFDNEAYLEINLL
jgi:hypothetical protein